MNSQLSTFMALSGLATANSHLTDPRPAWIWAEDGKSILWANPAGAAFFGVRSLSELADLSGLARAPARPHIMRIAASGPVDRDTTDRLRFYRGLRVMLLTCTCRRMVLADGSSAALIVANDAPAVRDTALSGLVALVADADDSTAVLYDGKGAIVDMEGLLDAPGFDAVSARLRSAKHAPVRTRLAFEDGDHAAALLMLDTGHTLAVIAAEPVATAEEVAPAADTAPSTAAETALADARADHAFDEDPVEGFDHEAGPAAENAEDVSAEIADTAGDADTAPQPQRRKWGIAGGGLFGFASATRFLSGSGTQDRANADARIDAERAQAVVDPAPDETEDAPTAEPVEAEADAPVADADEPDVSAVDEGLSLDRFAPDDSAGETTDQTSDDTTDLYATDDASADASAPEIHETAGGTSADPDLHDDAAAHGDTPADADVDAAAGFAFEARERPVRFAWKMDIDRRFTFLSAEFGEALGPEAADVVGLTWDEVCDRFGIDDDGRVAAALQRRDTWSGRTVDWPVSGAALRVPVDMAALPAFDRNRIFEGFRGFGVCRIGDAKDDPEATGTQLRLRPSLDALTATDDAHGEETGTRATDLPDDDALPEAGAEEAEETAIDAIPADEPRAEADAPNDDLSETAFPVDPSGEEIEDAGDEAEIAGGDGDQDHAARAPDDAGEADAAPDADDDGTTARDGKDDATSSDDGPSVEDLAGAAAAATLTAAGSGTRAASRDDDDGLAASRLSKPEREAFRKIAEALGGRSDAGDTQPVTEAPAADEHDVSDLLAALDDAEADTAPGEAPDEAPDGEIAADADTGEAENVRLDETDTDEEPDGIDDGSAADDGKAAPAPVAPVPARPYLTLASNKDDPAQRDDNRIDGDGDGDDMEAGEAAASHTPPAPPTRAQRTSLLDRLPVGVAIIDGTDVEYANATLLNLLGYPDTEALSAAGGLEALFAEPEDWPATVPGKMSERTMRLQLADGGARPVKARLHTVPWKGGNALMMSLLDRHDPGQEAALDRLHEVQSALALSEARVSEMDAVLETATDGVLILDEDGLIVKVNRSAEALFNASREEMVGVALVDYLAPESRRDAMDYLDGLARNGVASVLNDGREVIGQIRSGGLIPLFMTIGRVGQGDNGPHFCTVLRDITQWKTAEEELTDAKRQAENASSQKSDFLAKISHEIRTPLNAIIGFSEVMMEERFGPVGNDRYKGYLRDIHNSGSHIMSLINDLLDLSKIEAGKLELTFEAVSANDIIRECVALMQPQANRERVIIRASLPGSVPNIVADGRSVRQVILNLLSNAIKFNQPGGQVIVSSALEDSGEVILRVRDTGTGMSHKDLEAAMEPFRQLHTARHGGGTGLGLPLTKALVEANRASFRIDSEVNQGTLIEITFPPQRVLAE